MDSIRIRGGKPLSGKIRISGAKNAALPILCATLLSDGESLLRNVPDAARHRHDRGAAPVPRAQRRDRAPLVSVGAGDDVRPEAPYELVKQMRASVLVLGPLLARYGRAKVSLPGGCQIGARPVDQHLKGLEAMGAKIRLYRGYIVAECKRPPRRRGRVRRAHGDRHREPDDGRGAREGPHHAGELRARARGRGARPACSTRWARASSGAGTDVIHIEGADELEPFDHAIISDRIEAGTYMVAAAAAGGDVLIEDAPLEDLEAGRGEAAPGGRRGRAARASACASAARSGRCAPSTSRRRRTRASRPTCRRSSWS